MRKIKLFEVCSELGAGTRGASLGPDAMRIASLNAKSDFYTQFPAERIPDENQLLYTMNPTPNAKYLQGITTMYHRISDALSKSLKAGDFPVIITADHSSGGATIAGLKKAFPQARLGVVWVDAHADLHTPYTTPSGNVHGMPLAAALGEDNLDCAHNPVSVEEKELWDELKQVGGAGKLKPEDLIFMGVRDTEAPEKELMTQLGVKNYSVAECREKGIPEVVNEISQQLAACDMVYVSFDVDSMDAKISMGTGTPVKDGFEVAEATEILLGLSELDNLKAFELVEVNPTLDNQCNRMAEVAFEIIEKVTNKLL